MEKKDFVRLENMCQSLFMKAGECFHICSQENHPVLFRSDKEFRAAMNAVAFVALLFPDILVFTFEIMSNHFHFALSGQKERIVKFLHTLVLKLAASPELGESRADIRKLSFKTIPIENLDNLRNVITYINRNGYVVNPDHSPFSYPWGANRYFFNPEAKSRVQESGIKATCITKRKVFHSDLLAKNGSVIMLDGYVTPACFCRISEAEGFFRSCRHYFQNISRNIESAKDIAKSIGESIFYPDEDLFLLVGSICSREFGCPSAQTLTKDQKLDLARRLHYDYNATDKQISRILKIGIDIVKLIFP